jgi:hypothetical protein
MGAVLTESACMNVSSLLATHLASPLEAVVIDLLEAVCILQLRPHLTQLAAQLVNAVNAQPGVRYNMQQSHAICFCQVDQHL